MPPDPARERREHRVRTQQLEAFRAVLVRPVNDADSRHAPGHG
jgi:hypothetical protein